MVKDRKYLEAVKGLPCCACGKAGPSDAHHAIGVQFRGMGQKACDYNTMPLCKDCHQCGPNAIHQIGKRPWEAKNKTQKEYIEATQKSLSVVE